MSDSDPSGLSVHLIGESCSSADQYCNPPSQTPCQMAGIGCTNHVGGIGDLVKGFVSGGYGLLRNIIAVAAPRVARAMPASVLGGNPSSLTYRLGGGFFFLGSLFVPGGDELDAERLALDAAPARLALPAAPERLAITAARTRLALAPTLATAPDEAIFWSGIKGGDAAAASWAAKNGGSTLEMTLARRGIGLPVFDRADPASVAAWQQASVDFARGASGNVTVLQESAVRISSIWKEFEYPALIANSNVTSITVVNPVTGDEFLLWSR